MASTRNKGPTLTKKRADVAKSAAVVEDSPGLLKTGNTGVVADDARNTKLGSCGNEESLLNTSVHEGGTLAWNENLSMPTTIALDIFLSYDCVEHHLASSIILLLDTYETTVREQTASTTALAKLAVIPATQQRSTTALLTGVGTHFEPFILPIDMLETSSPGTNRIGFPETEEGRKGGEERVREETEHELPSNLFSATLLSMDNQADPKGDNLKVQLEAWFTNEFKYQMPITEYQRNARLLIGLNPI